MTLKRLKVVFLSAGLLLLTAADSQGQGIFTGINGTVINLSCDQLCTSLSFQVPHLKSDDDYTIASIPYTPYPYTTPTGNELTALYIDDLYSQAITLPFPICFYGEVYTQVVVGSNGLLTFDIANANCINAYTITPPIPRNGGNICNLNDIYYPKASVMGIYSDLDPTASASPLGRKIEWRMEGAAPFRRFIASWYRVGVFGNNTCGRATPTTFQIVINESTSVIEIFIDQKICQDNSTGRAILGIQDATRTKGVAYPFRNANFWSSNDEGFRLVPSGVTSRFVRSELYRADGVTLISTATATTPTTGLVDIAFPSLCTTLPSENFIVRTIYSSCIDPTQSIVINDEITIARDPELNATATATNTTCGAPSGTIEVAVPTGIGVSPFTAILNPGPSQVVISGPAPLTFSNVGQGTHTVVVTDASTNCTSTITNIVVNRTNNLTATVTPIATACASSLDGQVSVVPTTGSAPYNFLLNPGALTQTGATANFTGLAPNSYTVVVTDASGCATNPIPVIVTAGVAITTTATKTDVLCNGGATGTITITQPIAGTAPYQYSLDGVTWQTSNVFSGLTATTYTYYYRDASNCQNSQTITVDQPSILSATNATIPVICNGESNGTITVTPTGGVAPYQYSLDGVTWQTSNVFNVPANTYTVSIRDVNNCLITQPANVTQPAVLSASSVNTQASCDGGDDGTITVTAIGGNSSYQYSLDGITFQSSNIFNVGPGIYNVTVKDNLGCTVSFPATILLGNNFTLTPQTDVTICEGTSTQLALVSNATEYTWTPSTGLSSTSIYNPVANPAVTTEYIVRATLGRCSDEDMVIVNVDAAPIPNAGDDGFICYGQTYQLQASGGTQYSWSPTTYLDDPLIPNPVSTAPRDMTYSLSILSDVNGCASLVTDEVKIDVTPPVKVKTFPYDTIAYAGDQFLLLAVPSDPDAVNFVWTPSTGLSDPTSPNPMVTVGAVGDVVQYQVITSTIAGCKGEGYITVRVYKGPDIYMPTAFTPNGDGKNDRFIPVPVGMKTYKYFRVFNRWGQQIFSTTTLNDGWDGKMNGKDQPTGTYVWMIEGTTKDNKTVTKKGTVTLIR